MSGKCSPEKAKAAQRRYRERHREKIMAKRRSAEMVAKDAAYAKSWHQRKRAELGEDGYRAWKAAHKAKYLAKHGERDNAKRREGRERLGAKPRVRSQAAEHRRAIRAARHVCRGLVVRRKSETPAEKFRRRWASDFGFRVGVRMSVQIRKALKGDKHGRTWESVAGYPLADLVAHLEARFQPGMTRENFGAWHIDHIIPKSTFDLTKPEERRNCWALSNLQPLWARDNMRKSNRRQKALQMRLPMIPIGVSQGLTA